ncbi:MAG: PIN domain-containing protein [Nanoarchaeota archaeon]|nr:PIN domain-containing protein [Nanoarchaeota archaeon]
MIYIIDTYAWIEFINGTTQGFILKKLFDNLKNKFVTMECCLAELAGFALRKDVNFNEILNMVKEKSVILPVLTDTWIKAAKIRYLLRKNIAHFGLVDAILVAKQEELKCKVVSGDPHFKGLKNVVYIGE